MISIAAGRIAHRSAREEIQPSAPAETTVPPTTVVTEPPHHWETGYLGGFRLENPYCDEEGNVLEEPRHPEMKFTMQLPKQVPAKSIIRRSVELSAK